MKLKIRSMAALAIAICLFCDASSHPKGPRGGEGSGHATVQRLDSAKDSLKQSDDKQKAALEEANREIK